MVPCGGQLFGCGHSLSDADRRGYGAWQQRFIRCAAECGCDTARRADEITHGHVSASRHSTSGSRSACERLGSCASHDASSGRIGAGVCTLLSAAGRGGRCQRYRLIKWTDGSYDAIVDARPKQRSGKRNREYYALAIDAGNTTCGVRFTRRLRGCSSFIHLKASSDELGADRAVLLLHEGVETTAVVTCRVVPPVMATAELSASIGRAAMISALHQRTRARSARTDCRVHFAVRRRQISRPSLWQSPCRYPQ